MCRCRLAGALLVVASFHVVAASRPQQEAVPQETYDKMMRELSEYKDRARKYKTENEELKKDNKGLFDLEDKNQHMQKDINDIKEMLHGIPSSFMHAGYGGVPAYQPVSENSFSPGLPSSMFGPPSAQSFIQGGAGNANGGHAGSSSGKLNHNNYGASYRHHENFDSFLSHMETRQRNEDLDRALQTLRSALGDGSGNGELARDETQALESASQVHNGVGEWDAVSQQTMEAAPLMAKAVEAAAGSLSREHENLATEVREHGQGVLQKFTPDESS